jgi:PhnB protein
MSRFDNTPSVQRLSVDGMSTVQPIPEGFSTATPNLVVDRGAEAIDFYQRAFGAEQVARLEAGGMLVHAALRIGDSMITLCDAMPDHGFVAPDREAPVTQFITLYVEDADALHARALAAGATQVNAMADHIHGDRAGSVRDPFGHRWAIATHIADVAEEEMQRRLAEYA